MPDAGDLDDAPILSLFDNAILSRRDEDAAARPRNDPKSKPLSGYDQKTDKICQALLSLFPSPELEEQILKSSYWWAPWQNLFPNIFGVEGSSTSFRDFVLVSKASSKPQKIAKALLCMSLTLEEGKGFDDYLRDHGLTTSALGLGSLCGQNMETCVRTIDKLILSNDELASTIDGIECFILFAKHNSNNGRIRRSWIYHRRGLSFAQLLGLHRQSKNYSAGETQRRQSVWKALYQGDRFISLMLGMPYAVANTHSSLDKTLENPGASYITCLAEVAGDVIDRNLNPSTDGNFLDTVRIEGKLVEIASAMPPSWLRSDISPDEDAGIQIYSRLFPQFWHHQIRALLHLPFMLKASQDSRYEYSRIAALESAREMIVRYQVFRPVQGFESLVCKVIDFQVFTAAMILVLNLLGSRASNPKRNDSEDGRDWDLIISANNMLQHASEATDGSVANQSARALGMFVQARSTEGRAALWSTCKVVIPCFGTVVFGPGKDYAREPFTTETSTQFAHPAVLPTPAESCSGSITGSTPSAPDLFVSFDSYLAQMPFDFNFSGQPMMQQQPAEFDSYNNSFTNVDLDLDQDWAWYPVR